MKKEIIIFVIGLLLGAIISTGSILVYNTVTNSSTTQTETIPSNNGMPNDNMQNNNGTPPTMNNEKNS